MPEPLVRIRCASLFIPGKLPRELVLRNIDWTIAPGEHCALMGPNGSGKSSLLKFIHGDLWPASGEIAWNLGAGYETSPIAGRQLSGLVAPHIQADCQAHVWDAPAASLLAGAEAGSPFSYSIDVSPRIEQRILALMAELEGLPILNMQLGELSQGQMRLLLIGRELLREPNLLLLDEWEDGLDARHRQLAAEAFARRAERMTIIIATHKPDSIPDWIKNRRYLHKGTVHAQPQQPARQASASLPIIPKRKTPAQNGANVYELNNVSVFIDRKRVLRNINWRMRQGENWLITGPNGSGKSTFLRLLAGAEFIYAGGSLKHWSAKLGRQVESLAEKRQSASLVSDLGQALYGYELNSLELVLSGYENSVGIYRDFGKAERDWAKELIAAFFPTEYSTIGAQSIRRLSSGQLRRLYLARALVCKPDILLLDEPFSGLDQESRTSFLELLARLGAGTIPDLRPQLIMVSHQNEDMPESITNLASIKEGRLIPGL